MRRSAGQRWPGVAALAAGALPSLAFPAPGLWWLAYVALVPWLLLLRAAPDGRRAAWYGWLGGTGFVLATHHWLLPSLHVFLVPVAALAGLLWAPWGLLVHKLLGGVPRASGTAAALVLVPAGWLLVETVRSWEYLGGPWGLLGASQWRVEPVLRLMSVGGVWLAGLLVVLANTALAALLSAARAAPVGRAAARAAACGAGVAAALAAAGAWWVPPAPAGPDVVRVAVVQPGPTPHAQARFDRGARLTEALAGRGADLVVWGESSVGFDLADRPDLAERLRELSVRTGAPLMVNVDARRAGGAGIFKSSVVVDEGGPTGERYDKMRLVPFGEYVPARPLLGWATSVGRAAEEDRRRGTEQALFAVGDLRVGPLICFETTFPDLGRRLADAGADLLVAQSATSTFQESWAPEQHASLAALRAAETGRPVVHATLTGVSAVFGPGGGQVGRTLGTEDSTALLHAVPLGDGTSTFYVRHGDRLPFVAPVVLVGFGTVALLRRYRAGRR